MKNFLPLLCWGVLVSAQEPSKSKNPLPYFRRQVEEITEDGLKETVPEDSHTNIVSFLVKNLKEIFNDLGDKTEKTETSPVDYPDDTTNFPAPPPTIQIITPEFIKPSISIEIEKKKPKRKKHKVIENTTTTSTTIVTEDAGWFPAPENPLDKLRKDMTKKLLDVEGLNPNADIKNEVVVRSTDVTFGLDATEVVHETITPRTCIQCNNVLIDHCNDPKNTLIPSVTCERDSDLCYSQHTPFGIIERGCFNVNYNITTYVCSCNLCNYISISEMPYIFSKKQDWIDNVIELSRTRNFRKSVFKDMSCLRCEVNTTTKTGDMVESLNCLEGNIGALSVQDCEENEICGVKAVRSDGYIWRGCLKSPRYNYWWSLCDGDVCNLDPLLSIYNILL